MYTDMVPKISYQFLIGNVYPIYETYYETEYYEVSIPYR